MYWHRGRMLHSQVHEGGRSWRVCRLGYAQGWVVRVVVEGYCAHPCLVLEELLCRGCAWLERGASGRGREVCVCGYVCQGVWGVFLVFFLCCLEGRWRARSWCLSRRAEVAAGQQRSMWVLIGLVVEAHFYERRRWSKSGCAMLGAAWSWHPLLLLHAAPSLRPVDRVEVLHRGCLGLWCGLGCILVVWACFAEEHFWA